MARKLKKANRGGAPAQAVKKVAGAPWQIQTAKARFSEVFRLARRQGPQRITRQGKEGVVMMPMKSMKSLSVNLISQRAFGSSSANPRW